MKRYPLIPLLLIVLAFASCEKFLDPKPDNHYGNDIPGGYPGRRKVF